MIRKFAFAWEGGSTGFSAYLRRNYPRSFVTGNSGLSGSRLEDLQGRGSNFTLESALNSW